MVKLRLIFKTRRNDVLVVTADVYEEHRWLLPSSLNPSHGYCTKSSHERNGVDESPAVCC